MPSGIYKRTKEHNKNISKANKNRIFSDEHKKNLREAGKGRIAWNKNLTKETDERVKKYSKTKIGKYCGKNHPNWKGGIAVEPYCDVWIDKEYKESIKERDNYTCQNPFCLCDSSKLDIHHINYIKKDCKPDNLITLCRSSNSKANYNRWFWKEIYEKIIEVKI